MVIFYYILGIDGQVLAPQFFFIEETQRHHCTTCCATVHNIQFVIYKIINSHATEHRKRSTWFYIIRVFGGVQPRSFLAFSVRNIILLCSRVAHTHRSVPTTAYDNTVIIIHHVRPWLSLYYVLYIIRAWVWNRGWHTSLTTVRIVINNNFIICTCDFSGNRHRHWARENRATYKAYSDQNFGIIYGAWNWNYFFLILILILLIDISRFLILI